MDSSGDDSKPYGQWVREQRKKLGMSHTELAKRAGLSLAQIYNIETGRTKNPQAKTRSRLSQVLAGTVERGCNNVAAGSDEPGCNVVAFPKTPKRANREDGAEPCCSFCNRPLAMAMAIAWLSDTGNPTVCVDCLNKLNSIFARSAQYENDGKTPLRLVQK